MIAETYRARLYPPVLRSGDIAQRILCATHFATGTHPGWGTLCKPAHSRRTKIANERVYAQIGNGTPAAMRISDGYRDGSPLKLAQTETVSVDVRALYASSKDSYEVEWTETTFDLKGEQIGTQNYKGVITISIHPPADEGLARVNPLGIYVTNVSWSKVL